MSKPVVSFIMPIYNAEDTLEQSAESVLRQTYHNIELVLVDDGSTDESARICDRLSQVDHRVKVIHKQNAGVSAARNTGIDNCVGDYICFIDSDDVYEPRFTATALRAFTENNIDLYICGLRMEPEYDAKLGEYVDYSIKKTTLFSVKTLLESMERSYPLICICGPWCKVWRATIVKTYKCRFNTSLCYGEDTSFNLDCFQYIKTILFDEAVFYQYIRSNVDSLYSRFHKDNYEVHSEIYGKMIKLMSALQCNEQAIRRSKTLYYNMLIGCIHEYYRFPRCTSHKEKRALIKKIAQDEVLNSFFPADATCKNLLLYVALKLKWYDTIIMLFDFHYRKNQKNYI